MKSLILLTPPVSCNPTESKGNSTVKTTEKGGEPSYVVIEQTKRTTSHKHEKTTEPHGISPAECKRYSEAIHYLKRRGCGLHISLRAEDSRNLKTDIAILQRRRRARVLWVEVRESDPEPGSHIIAVMPTATDREWLAERLMNGRNSWPQDSGNSLDCRPIRDWNWPNYLLKEATSQAWYGAGKNFRRKKGSHRLPGGGDRVRLSDSLKKALLGSNKIEPYEGEYRARKTPTKRRPPVPVGYQFDIFSPAVTPPVPVLRLVEDKRRELGISQRELAPRLGIRQAAYANALRGHDRLGPWALNRALDFVADRLAA